MYESNLEIALKHSKNSARVRKLRPDECPEFTPERGVDALHAYMDALSATNDNLGNPEISVIGIEGSTEKCRPPSLIY